MAFKREGDDLSQLNALRKRRVADLLASYIPEDEAILMKNGRYACSVCYNRPVFDTVDVLAVHRTGKRHVAGLQRFYRNKWGLRLEIQKRRHQQHVREEEEAGDGGQQTGTELAPLLSQTRRITRHALLKAAPYNSCCKRTRSGGEGPSPSPGRGDPAATSEAGGGPELPRGAGGASIADTQPTASLPAGSHVEEEEVARRAKKRRRGKAAAASRSSAADPERRKLVEHYLTLRSSGWIQDSCGRWMRDETVEFDSDEEEPPPLSLP